MIKEIIEIENARKSQEAFEKAAIQRDLYWGYWNSKEYGNDLIDLDDIKWEKDVPVCVEQMRKFGIEEFTISSTWSGVIEVLELFEKNGVKLVGLATVKGQPEWDGTERTKPAFLMKVM